MSNNHERKILHVDDDPSILRIVASVLSKRGYTVVSVSDPSQAIPSLIQTSTRLVILDIDMQKSGLSLPRRYQGGRQKHPGHYADRYGLDGDNFSSDTTGGRRMPFQADFRLE